MDNNEEKKNNDFLINEDEFLQKVEEASRRGAEKGSRSKLKVTNYLKLAQSIIVIAVFACLLIGFMNIKNEWGQLGNKLADITKLDAADNHDTILDNDGIFGFTAADFAEPLLGDKSQLKVLEVYSCEVSDVVTITDAGFMGWQVLSKAQMVTYRGTATYVVDLSKLNEKSINVDNENKKVILTVPKVTQNPINIDENDMEFADTEKGLLSFGEIKITPQDLATVQSEARDKMQAELDSTKVMDEAKRFAKMTIWEIYQPLVTASAPGYVLEVEFE